MGFADDITRAPFPFDAERAAETVALLPDAPAEARDLLRGAGGCSPYLRGLIEKEAEWLGEALTADTYATFDRILDSASALDDASLKSGLRMAKRRVALLTALADLGGVWSLEDVTGALTRFADLAVDRSLAGLVDRYVRRGKLPPVERSGISALAMGKMGAFELNYSSDIDLIMLFDESAYDPADRAEARSIAVRITREMSALLSDVTGEGYVFRVDLRLRPDPAVTPVCVSVEAAERYYESVGRAWERAAFIKARPCGGDIEAGAAFLDRITPFVWRRHLDFAAVQDAQSMRLKIREHKAPDRRALEDYDLKLGPGGIREIEFYTQTRQLIAGGRDPSLRERGTVPALRALEAAGWSDAADDLISAYRAHRTVEHRLQMIADRQTHSLPKSREGFERLAAFLSTDPDTLRTDLRSRLDRIAGMTDEFFAPAEAQEAPDLADEAQAIVARWPSYPALRSDRAVAIFERVKPKVLSRLATEAKPLEALSHIDRFLQGLPAGVQVFSLFDANPQLIDLFVDIAATSHALANHLGRHPQVLDAVIGGGFFSEWPGIPALERDLAAHMARADDYETRLLAARIWRNEWHFRVGVHHLRGLIDTATAGAQYAGIADATLGAIWSAAVEEFARKHGSQPGRGATVLGMGSLGASALTATSDLDLIVIYDPLEETSSDGRRPLDTRTYYARLTQAFVTALTAQMGPGRLYDVDMRLRPSGRQGPVATSLAAFRMYQTEEAWTWEHLALTRARPVAGSDEVGADVEAFRRELLDRDRARDTILQDVANMRARLAEAKPGAGTWDVKAGPGRLQDIDLAAQSAALLSGLPATDTPGQLSQGYAALGISRDVTEDLLSAYALFQSVNAVQRLIAGDEFAPEQAGTGGAAFLLRETGMADMSSLEQKLTEAGEASAAHLAKLYPDAHAESGHG